MKPEKKQVNNSFVDGNKFFILGEFTDELNHTIILPLTKKIDELSKVKDATIEFHINSPGGNGWIVMHIVRLAELAKAKGIKIKTIVPQAAYSSGSILAIIGDERFIGSTAEHCVHYGQQYGYTETTPLQIERNAESKKRWFKQLLDHYKKYSSIPNIDELIKDDSLFISAKDCIKWGLADKYMEEM